MKNLLTEHARLLVHGMARAGVRRFVVCPGSRSTPLVLAAARVDAHVEWAHDERSAAFLALGHARVTGAPTVVICTSGTAAAHFYPAVLEAEAAHLPLIVMSADRPPSLVGVGAPQTIDQLGLFGDHVNAAIALALPDAARMVEVQGYASEAVAASRAPRPGPVHINVPAEKPLEDFAPVTDEGRALVRAVDDLLIAIEPREGKTPRVDDATIERIARRLDEAERPLFVVGTLPIDTTALESIQRLAGSDGVVVADVTSQCRVPGTISTADALLPHGPDVPPDFILRIGRIPTVSGWNGFFAKNAAVPTVVVPGASTSDPYGTADEMALGDVDDALARLADRVGGRAWDASYKQRWLVLEARARRVIEQGLPWSEAAVARTLSETWPDDGLLMAGNSLAVRHLDLYATPTEHRVLSQRGVNGIDGLIAGAVGSASAAARPLALLFGDVSYLHDVGSLALAAKFRGPLALVVIDNRGGRIFEQLPLAETDPPRSLMDFFVTPHEVDLGAVARAYGLTTHEVESASALRGALEASHQHRGVSVVIAKVDPHDAVRVRRSVLEACP